MRAFFEPVPSFREQKLNQCALTFFEINFVKKKLRKKWTFKLDPLTKTTWNLVHLNLSSKCFEIYNTLFHSICTISTRIDVYWQLEKLKWNKIDISEGKLHSKPEAEIMKVIVKVTVKDLAVTFSNSIL